MKKKLLSIFFVFIIFQNLYSVDGDLDTATFNPPNGFVLGPDGQAFGVAINSVGQIFAVGRGVGATYSLARFSTTGLFENSVTGAAGFVRGIAIQADEKIVIAGIDTGLTNTFVIRYNPDLTVDTIFESILGMPNYVQIQADSKIVVAGTDSAGINVFVARFNPDGTTDDTFGLNGVATGSPPGGAQDLVFQPDGKIVVAGVNAAGTLIVRYNTNGTIDTSFGTLGSVAIPDGGVATAVLMQPDQKIITVGFANGATTNVIRLENNGTLDPTFGIAGIYTSNDGTSFDGIIQPDGKIVVFGDGNGNVYLERITTLGTLDMTFGVGGFVLNPAGNASGGAIQKDSKLISAGANSGGTNFLIARYLNSVPLVPTTITFPVNNATIDSNSFIATGTAQNPSNVFLFLNGSLIGGVPTDPAGSNTWEFTISNLTAGTYTLLAVALYKDGQVNISSELITFTIGSVNPIPPTPPTPVPVLPTCSSAIVNAIISKYCPLRL